MDENKFTTLGKPQINVATKQHKKSNKNVSKKKNFTNQPIKEQSKKGQPVKEKVKEPSVKEPSVKEPSVKEPSVKEPSVKEPSVKELSIKENSIIEEEDVTWVPPMKKMIKGKDSPYVVLMETSGEEIESWYYFIKYNNNKENLEHLRAQLDKVNFYILDDLSTFDLDLENFVTAQTAKEMTKVEVNHTSFHRKFDGRLKKIDLNLRNKDTNKKKLFKCFDKLGYGQIEDYISDEDVTEMTGEYLSDDNDEDFTEEFSDDSSID